MQVTTDAHSGKKLSAIKAFKEGWSLVRGLKFPVFLLLSLQMIFFCVQWMVDPRMPSISLQAKEHMANVDLLSLPPSTLLLAVGVCLVFGASATFLAAMLAMLGIRKSLGLSIGIPLVFSECKKAWLKIIALSIVESILLLILDPAEALVSFGIAGKITYYVLTVGCLYIIMAFMLFSLPLLVIKPTTSVIFAIKVGIQKMNANWLAMILIFLVFSVLGALSVFTLGIALIWVMPWCYAATGVCFRDAYGIKKDDVA